MGFLDKKKSSPRKQGRALLLYFSLVVSCCVSSVFFTEKMADGEFLLSSPAARAARLEPPCSMPGVKAPIHPCNPAFGPRCTKMLYATNSHESWSA